MNFWLPPWAITHRYDTCGAIRVDRGCHRPYPARQTSPGQRVLRPSRTAGFSLLEVIAAILLLAIAFTALMKVAGASMALSHNAAQHSQVAMHARSLLDSAFVGEPIKPGSSSGRFDSQYRWQLDVSPWQAGGPVAPDAPIQLYQLDLTVSWGPSARPRNAHFRSLRLGGPLASGQVNP